jgi:hypothetical protein
VIRVPALAPAFLFLGLLDLAPKRLHGLGREIARFAEDMRVPTQELSRDALDDVAEVERARFLGHAGVEHDLQQEVTELVPEIEKIAARDRIGDLASLLDRIGRDGREILLEIPRTAAAGRAQRGHDLDQALDLA